MYYQLNKILNYKCVYNFIIGHRGVGKTYALKCYCLRRFLKHGEEFVWVRRYKSELSEAKSDFMKDIAEKFPGIEVKIDGNRIVVNNKVAGYFIPLSVSSKFKSKPFPKVRTIVFDEFLITKSSYKYLPNETIIFNELYSTVDRYKDVTTAFFIGNAISFVNPYFIDFKIYQTKNQFTLDPTKQAIVEHFKSQPFIDMAKATKFGKLTAGTSYEKYAIENEYLEDNNNFIAKRPQKTTYLCCIVFEGKKLGFWLENKSGKVFACESYDKSSRRIFTLLCEDHSPNMIMIRRLKLGYMRDLRHVYEQGKMYFEDQICKKLFEKIQMYL